MDHEYDQQASSQISPDGVTPAGSRHIFREMIKAEIEAQPLSRRRRRELLDFAPHLDIPASEATLLIRAVEIECEIGLAPSSESATVDSSYLAHSAGHPTSLIIGLLFLSLLLGGFLLSTVMF